MPNEKSALEASQRAVESAVKVVAEFNCFIEIHSDVDRIEDVKADLEFKDVAFDVYAYDGFYEIVLIIETPFTFGSENFSLFSVVESVVIVNNNEGRLVVASKSFRIDREIPCGENDERKSDPA